MNPIKLHDLVAITENIKTQRLMSPEEIILPRGQVGTVVEEYNNGTAFEVEFSDVNGQTYALVSLTTAQIMLLYPDSSNLSLTY
ncbi:DUF4926 domain-containing protein [[Phormidium] sp. ETS-05]|uniref:DUF4926 domain-containing protein n=1 Tax=[Phormidium] sp. ETS-05 TaxID=222819 RepID=UPI001E3464FA|nr:DUF4926 domain-containing protein [[Phormidium] sp. ETS-05]